MIHTLYMSVRSPFARRVRLTLEELGVEYETQVLDVFNPPPGFTEVNPLGRVPALRLPNTELIVDSWMILDYLRERHGSHPLFLTGGASGAQARNISGLAVGVMEQAVAVAIESMRPTVAYPPARAEYVESARRGLALLDSLRGFDSSFMLDDQLRLCDIDVGVALAYCELRLGRDFIEPYPALRAHLALANQRESFRKTAPPA